MRHEYIDGGVRMMVGASRRHSLMCADLITTLGIFAMLKSNLLTGREFLLVH